MKKFDLLYHKGRSEKIYSWQVWADGDSVYTEYGTIDGKKQVSSYKVKMKNLGKINETSLESQAEIEAEAMFKHKLERNYSLSVLDAKEIVFLPMLAHEFMKKKKKIIYPAHIQPKLDGVRALAYWGDDRRVHLLSRGGKEYKVKHIIRQLEAFLPKDTVMDGELYIHGESLQTIVSLVKKEKKRSRELDFYIFDCPTYKGTSNLEWKDRSTNLVELFSVVHKECSNIVLVESKEVKNEGEVFDIQGQFISEGFEGAIIRNLNGLYQFGFRSSDLLKLKDFKDEEFKVVGFKEGVGRFKGCVIWRCITKDKLEFDVVPRGALEQKAAWFKEAGKYVGEKLIVRYQRFTDEGKPFLPVGICFRDYE